MKKNQINLLLLIMTIGIFSACKKDDSPERVETESEYKYVRLLISDANTKQLTLLNPVDGQIKNFEARNAKASVYTTASGRFATLVEREFNFVEIFDSGFESHGDHIDVKGTPKFAALTGTANKPTHFKTKGNEIITFNDGDGTLSTAKEDDFHTVGKGMTVLNAGLTAHHGAMAKFDNGNYAVTVKDGSIAGTLPERVKIVDASGTQVFASTVSTQGIHGSASNGKVALFGSASGVLMVNENGSQELISYPQNFGANWFGTVLETDLPNKFIGFTASTGAYLIDVNAKSITPIFASADILQCKLDYAKKNVVAMFYDGSIKIYKVSTGTVSKEGNSGIITDKAETLKPFFVATEKYVYVVLPKSGEVKQFSTTELKETKVFKVSATPFSATVLGFESDESH